MAFIETSSIKEAIKSSETFLKLFKKQGTDSIMYLDKYGKEISIIDSNSFLKFQNKILSALSAVEDYISKRPLVYKALLTQTGTDAPTAIVLENTIGDIVFSRLSTGNYKAELAGAFTEDKTFVLMQGTTGEADTGMVTCQVQNTNFINILSSDAGVNGAQADDILVNASLLIEIYS